MAAMKNKMEQQKFMNSQNRSQKSSFRTDHVFVSQSKTSLSRKFVRNKINTCLGRNGAQKHNVTNMVEQKSKKGTGMVSILF